jgi:hypothetical protein
LPDSIPIPLDLLTETRDARNMVPREQQIPVNNRRDCANMQQSEKPARDREIEVLERKLKAMIALGEEALNRLRELKAA